jgi:hypothetical protein
METLYLAMLDHYVPDVPEQVRLGEGTLPRKLGEPGTTTGLRGSAKRMGL